MATKYETVTLDNGEKVEVKTDELNRTILLDRLQAYAEKEDDPDEKGLLEDLAKWLESVGFAE